MPNIRIGEKWNVDPTKLLLRPYDGTAQDLAALTHVRNETLRATTLPDDFSEVSPEEMDCYYSLGDFTLVSNAWLMLHDANPVAAAIVYPMAAFHDRPPGNFHLYVAPQLWGHGIGSRLLAHLEQAALARGYPALETTVAREDGQSCDFLKSHGFQAVGYSVHLARSGLEGIPVAQLPDGFSIKSLAELGESAQFYRDTANRLGSYDPNYSLISAEEIGQLVETGKWDPTGSFFVLDPDERVVGVIRASMSDESKGYLNEIRLEPASRGKGLGMAMVASALDYLAASEVTRVELDTASENAAARNLALRAGFEESRHWLHFLKQLRNQK